MPGIGFMNYRRRSAVPVGGRYRRRVLRVRMAPGGASGRVTSSSYRWARKRIAPIVKSIVSRQEETKTFGTIVCNAQGENAQIVLAGINNVFAPMAQGNLNGQRNGDKVRPTGLRIKGCISYNDVGQPHVLSPMVVKIFCLQWKGLKDSTGGFANVPINQLIDAGGSITSWDGSAIRAMCDINKEAFQVLGSRTLKISDTDVENHKVETKSYTMNIKCPSVLTYNNGGGYPSNFAPFLVVGWFYETGLIPAPTDINVVHTAHSMLYYKDA